MLATKPKRKAVVFGTGAFAEVVDFYLTHDSAYDVVAFTATTDAGNFRDRPLVPFEELKDCYPPDDHDLFVAIGYARMNSLRESFMEQARAKGYPLLNYICSRASHWGDTAIGDNVFIFEDNTIQPFVNIGAGTILWSGNHIGHHSTIGPYCFISSHVVISGNCTVGSHCFIGVNATIADGISIGDRCLIGPGALIQKATAADTVYTAERAKLFPKTSGAFLK